MKFRPDDNTQVIFDPQTSFLLSYPRLDVLIFTSIYFSTRASDVCSNYVGAFRSFAEHTLHLCTGHFRWHREFATSNYQSARGPRQFIVPISQGKESPANITLKIIYYFSILQVTMAIKLPLEGLMMVESAHHQS